MSTVITIIIAYIANDIAVKSNPFHCTASGIDSSYVSYRNVLYTIDPFSMVFEKDEYSGNYTRAFIVFVNNDSINVSSFTKEQLEENGNVIQFENGQFGMTDPSESQNSSSSDSQVMISFYYSLMEIGEQGISPMYYDVIYIVFESISGEYYYYPLFYYCDVANESEEEIDPSEINIPGTEKLCAQTGSVAIKIFDVPGLYNRMDVQSLLNILNNQPYIETDFTVDTFTSQIESELALIRSKLEP